MITSQALLDAYRHPVVVLGPSTPPPSVCTRLALCWVPGVAGAPQTALESPQGLSPEVLAEVVAEAGVSAVLSALGPLVLAEYLPGTLATVFARGLAGEAVDAALLAEVVGPSLTSLPGAVFWHGVLDALDAQGRLGVLTDSVGPEVLARCLPPKVLARVVVAGLAADTFDPTTIVGAVGIETLARALPVGNLLDWARAPLVEATPPEPEPVVPITAGEFLTSHWHTIQEISRARTFRYHGLSDEEFAQEIALYAGARAAKFNPALGTIGVWLWNQARAAQKALIRQSQRARHEVQGSMLQGHDDDRFWLDRVADGAPSVEDTLVDGERSDETLVRMALLRREASEKEMGWIRAQLDGATSSQELYEATGYSGRYARLIGQRFRQRVQEQARV